MCMECLKSPCDPRCPNAPDQEEIVVFECSRCGRKIFDGEDCWNIDDEKWCECCIDNARQTARAAL